MQGYCEKYIHIKGANENNLKNISLKIPRNKITAVVGVSGSGKSSLIIDVLQKESMRQLFDTMGNQRQIKKPMVESIDGLSPVIYIDQHITNRNPRSSVGTVTELLKYIRLLYAQVGIRECCTCGHKILPLISTYEIEDDGSDSSNNIHDIATDKCPSCGNGIKKYRMADFSYNNPNGACPKCHGIGQIYSINRPVTIDEELSIYEGAFKSWGKNEIKVYVPIILAASKYYGFEFDPNEKIKNIKPETKSFVYYGNDDKRFKEYYPDVKRLDDKRLLFGGFINEMESTYEKMLDNEGWTERFGKFFTRIECSECNGTRLSRELENVKVNNRSINKIMEYTLEDIKLWILSYKKDCKDRIEGKFVSEVIDIMLKKLNELIGLGIGYLSLSRSIISLSYGEHQRLRLANLLGSNLTEMIYIFDEPTIGLHPSDNDKIMNAINILKNNGNTVIIIEHDYDLIRKADYIVEIGPEAGTNGGELLFEGSMSELMKSDKSIIKNYLIHRPTISRKESITRNTIEILNATKHNLKGIDAHIAMNKINVVTGVSGSGKSSLIFDVLVEAFKNYFKSGIRDNVIKDYDKVDNLICMSQKPISKGSRSNIATYTEMYTHIRMLFEKQPKAKVLRLDKKDFSFNVKGGRCEHCEGNGIVELNMVLMPTMEVQCPVCKGKRFKKEVLEVKYKDKNITEILNTTCAEALSIFQDVPKIYKILRVINDIGLGYLSIGHKLNQLSGGECQRMRLVKELSKTTQGRVLYVFDEPTSGLHPQDIEKLFAIMKRLVSHGHTLIVIEHNLQLIIEANHIIDLGKGGGAEGGELVYEGDMKGILENSDSLTGRCLNEYLESNFYDCL